MSAVLEFRDVTVAGEDGRLRLANVSMALEPGTVTAIIGRSGSGKTTLLRTANRLVKATQGHIYFEGQYVTDAGVVPLRRRMGYVIQETGLFPHLTIERNVSIVLEAQGETQEKRSARSNELLRMVGLDPGIFSQRLPHQLSGGQRQRVGLARAIASKPKLLLMDEPFGALDPLTRAEMQDMLRNLLQELHTTVLLVTHDLGEAVYLAERIVLLDAGRLVADLSREQFFRSPDPHVTAYVHAYHRTGPHQGTFADAGGPG